MDKILEINSNEVTTKAINRIKRVIFVPPVIRILIYIFSIFFMILSAWLFIIHVYGDMIEYLFIVICMWISYFFIIHHGTRVLKKQFGHNNFMYDLVFYDDHVDLIINGKLGHEYHYNAYKRVYETKEEYVIITKTHFLVIPKQNLDSLKEKQFRQLLLEKCVKKIKKIR